MKRALLSIGLLAALAVGGHAANERAKFDLNQIPTMMGVDSVSGEVRRIRTNAAGELIFSGELAPVGSAFSVRCVSIDGTTFESCGTGPIIQNVNIISTFSATNPGFVNANQNGLWTIDNAAGASAVNIQDGGNSITIDDGGGSITVDGVFEANVFISTVSVGNVDGTSLSVDDFGGSLTVDDGGITLSVDDGGSSLSVDQSGVWILSANSGVDIGDVTINNAVGGAAVNIQDGGNSITIDAVSLPLPAGAATEATISSIDGKMATLGQKIMSGSMPVAIASDQSAIPINDNGGSLTVDGTIAATQSGGWTVTANAGSGIFSSDVTDRAARILGRAFLRNPGDTANMGDATTPVRVDPTGTTTQPVSDAGGSLTVDGTITANQGGAWILSANSGVDIGDVTINNAGAGAAVNIQDGGNIISIDDAGGSITIDGSITADVSFSSVSVDNVAGTSLAVDDNGGSLTVDGTIAATQSGTWILGANSGVDIGDVTINNAGAGAAVNIQDGGNSITIDATSLPLPTGAATSALQTTGNSSLSSIDGKLASLGQKTSAGSMPVVIASDQSGITVNAGTGNFGTNLVQVGGVAVDVDAGNSGSGTQRVVIATDQAALPVTGSFGVPTSASVSKSSVTLDLGISAEIIAANGSRLGWECRALTSNTDTIFLNLGAGAAVVTDWPLEPGDYYTPTETQLYTGAIQAIEGSGSQVIRCQEF